MKLMKIYENLTLVERSLQNVIFYHGTENKFDKFDLKFFGTHDYGWLGYGVYVTNDIEYAKSYGRVLKCTINITKPYIVHDTEYSRSPDRLMKKLGVTGYEGHGSSRVVTQKLHSAGYDSVILTYNESSVIGGKFMEVCIFNPSNVTIIRPNKK